MDATFRIRTYTLPFMLPQMEADNYDDTALFLWEDGEIVMVFTDTSEERDVTSVVHRLPLAGVVPLLVTGPKI